jgi:hypothetical protein
MIPTDRDAMIARVLMLVFGAASNHRWIGWGDIFFEFFIGLMIIKAGKSVWEFGLRATKQAPKRFGLAGAREQTFHFLCLLSLDIARESASTVR